LVGNIAGDYVAHIKFTVLLMPNGSDRITSHSLQELQPSKTIDDPEIKAWLALGTKTKKKGGGKKKKGKLGELTKKKSLWAHKTYHFICRAWLLLICNLCILECCS
jgi:hypothetical protein